MRLTLQRALWPLWRGRRGESGASAVSLAFLMPVFLLLIVGVIEMGRMLFIQGVLNYATEEATRFAVVNFEVSESVIHEVAADKFLLIDPEKIVRFVVTAPLDPDDQTKLVTVEVDYRFDFLIPLIKASSFTLKASSRGFITEN